MDNTVTIGGKTKTPYQMTNQDALLLAEQVLQEVGQICRSINHEATQGTTSASKFQRGMAGDSVSLAKNQLNWASAYATNTVDRLNVSEDQKVIWACQAQGCLDNAKGWLKKK